MKEASLLQQEYRLKKRKDFRYVYRFGHSVANRQFVVYTKKRHNEQTVFRLGVSVSRKVGNAVIRNRIRRLVKEATRGWKDLIRSDIDLVVIARRPTATMDYQQIEASLRHVYSRAQCFKTMPDKKTV